MAIRLCLLLLGALSLAAAAGDGDPAKNWESSLAEGRALYERGRYHDAEPKLAEAVQRVEGEGLSGYPLVITLSNLGACYVDLGRYREAESYLRRAIRAGDSTQGSTQLALAVALNNFGVLMTRVGRTNEALESFDRSLEIRRRLLGPEHSAVARQLHNMARLHVENKHFDRAEQLYREAIGVWEKLDGSADDLAAGLIGLSTLYVQRKNPVAAFPLAERAVRLWEDELDRNHPTYAFLLNNLATVHIESGHFESAEPLVKQALDIAKLTLGEEHPETANILTNYAVVLKKTSRKREGRMIQAQARDILTRHVQRNLLQHTIDASQFLREPH